VIDEHWARREVERVIANWPPSPDPDEAFVVWKVEEHSRAWILHFATRRWIETRAFSDQAVGSCPFVVDKATGDVHLYGSGEYDTFMARRGVLPGLGVRDHPVMPLFVATPRT
jgi:hypothetical protein